MLEPDLGLGKAQRGRDGEKKVLSQDCYERSDPLCLAGWGPSGRGKWGKGRPGSLESLLILLEQLQGVTC